MTVRTSKTFLLGLVALGLLAATPAFAQSTGTQEIETVVVTGAVTTTAGLMTPLEIPKQRSIISKEFIDTQAAGQTVFDTLNTVPGLNFTNSDPYGNSGGNIRLHGMDGNRISLTWDGMPLNDTGNYATFTNQIVDTEIIDRVSVNQGTTDVDSPTASSVGGVINILTTRPADNFAVMSDLSYGSDNYMRGFVRVDSGEVGPWGTRMFGTYSYTMYDKFKGPGNLQKVQVNGDIYQDMGTLGWANLAVHFNRNRNDFYNSATFLPAFYQTAYNSAVVKTLLPNPSPLNGVLAVAAPNIAYDQGGNFTGGLTPGVAVPLGGFGIDFDEDPVCVKPTPVNGTVQNEAAFAAAALPAGSAPSSCTGFYKLRINPSDTGNIRASSLWHLTSSLTATLDANFQYVLANGGGFTTVAENDPRLRGPTQAVAGKDLNGDGDILDTVGFYTPNNTNTRRYGVNAQLIYQLNETNTFQLAYVLDWGLHRQTGYYSTYDAVNGPNDVFGGLRDPAHRVTGVDGYILRTRDRKSYAILNQYSFNYEGRYLNDTLRISAGIRLPFFDRDLNQYCYNQTTGFPLCTSENPTTALPGTNGTFAFANLGAARYTPPGHKSVSYNRGLPNAGIAWFATPEQQLFFTYAQGISVPRTDNLYIGSSNGNAACLPPNTNPAAFPCVYSTFSSSALVPETTATYDLGYRFQGSWASATVVLWNTQYKNRIVSTFDPDQNINVDHNIGTVNMAGMDIEGTANPMEDLDIYGSISYLKSRVAPGPEALITTAVVAGVPVKVNIAGKQVVETPNWTFSGRIQYKIAGFRLGLGAKFVGRRYATDLNDFAVPSYTTANADVTYDLGELGWESSYLKFNVSNIFDTVYIGSIPTTQTCFTPVAPTTAGCVTYPRVNMGAPRSFQIELRTVF